MPRPKMLGLLRSVDGNLNCTQFTIQTASLFPFPIFPHSSETLNFSSFHSFYASIIQYVLQITDSLTPLSFLVFISQYESHPSRNLKESKV